MAMLVRLLESCRGWVLGERWQCCWTDGRGQTERHKGSAGSLRYPFLSQDSERFRGVKRSENPGGQSFLTSTN